MTEDDPVATKATDRSARRTEPSLEQDRVPLGCGLVM